MVSKGCESIATMKPIFVASATVQHHVISFSLIFSAFVAVLDVVEYFMDQIHNKISFGDGNELGKKDGFFSNE